MNTFYAARGTALRDMEDDFGLVPYPKYDEQQADYLSYNLGTSYLAITKSALNPEMSAAVMEALSAANHKTVIPVLEDIKAGKCDLHFIEVMTCPEGCVSGGGQPKLLMDADRPEAYAARRANTLSHDENLPLRKSHENPSIKMIYEEFLGEPNSHKSHELLHTHYCTGKNKWK